MGSLSEKCKWSGRGRKDYARPPFTKKQVDDSVARSNVNHRPPFHPDKERTEGRKDAGIDVCHIIPSSWASDPKAAKEGNESDNTRCGDARTNRKIGDAIDAETRKKGGSAVPTQRTKDRLNDAMSDLHKQGKLAQVLEGGGFGKVEVENGKKFRLTSSQPLEPHGDVRRDQPGYEANKGFVDHKEYRNQGNHRKVSETWSEQDYMLGFKERICQGDETLQQGAREHKQNTPHEGGKRTRANTNCPSSMPTDQTPLLQMQTENGPQKDIQVKTNAENASTDAHADPRTAPEVKKAADCQRDGKVQKAAENAGTDARTDSGEETKGKKSSKLQLARTMAVGAAFEAGIQIAEHHLMKDAKTEDVEAVAAQASACGSGFHASAEAGSARAGTVSGHRGVKANASAHGAKAEAATPGIPGCCGVGSAYASASAGSAEASAEATVLGVKASAEVTAAKVSAGLQGTPLQASLSGPTVGASAGLGLKQTGAAVGIHAGEAQAGHFAVRAGVKVGAEVSNGIPVVHLGPVSTPCTVM
eukprot:Skav224372  [mRNA]  locus=scaffold2603:84609:86308:+ [translate_table: standard]